MRLRVNAYYAPKRGANPGVDWIVGARPDLDNVLKLVMDALTGIAWRDDRQVCEIVASKVQTLHASQCVSVTIEPLTDPVA
jgi:Holliday junction resolvase RusA-like endonuclease